MDVQQTARAITARIILRERQIAQTECLDLMFQSSIGRHLALVGSSALHGVHLHGRVPQALDIEAPYPIAAKFAALTARLDNRFVPAADGRGVEFVSASITRKETRVQLRIYARQEVLYPPMELFFGQGENQAKVRCHQVGTLAAAKLGGLLQRYHPLDFYDLWLTLKQQDITIAALQVMRDRRWNCGGYTPPFPFSAAVVMHQMRRVESSWDGSMSRDVLNAPDYATVYADLPGLLQSFETRQSAPTVSVKERSNTSSDRHQGMMVSAK